MIKTTVKIDGMMCGMCESHVNDAIRKEFPDIQKVNSSHKKGLTEIISENEITEEQLRAVIDPTGYKVLGVSSEPYTKKKFSLFGK